MRKILFWTHLTIGLTAAVVILILCVTGVLLMYERQMLAWADRGIRSTPLGERMAPEALLRAFQEQTGRPASSLTLRSDPTAPAEVAAGADVFYLDVYSGKLLGVPSPQLRKFFRTVVEWHRWLALEGPRRPVGKAITGAANFIFLFIVLTGMYLWLPRRWSWQHVRAVLFFRRGLSGRARDFNWHNVIGIWSALPLIAIILGALVISYPWATDLVYRLAGDNPPPRPVAASPGASAQKNFSSQRPARTVQKTGPDGTASHPQESAAAAHQRESDAGLAAGLDQACRLAEQLVPAWESMSWRAAPGPRLSLTIAGSHRGRVDLRSTLTVDRASGQVVQHETFDRLTRGRQWRLWLRFIHTGEALGFAGQTIAGVVSAGAAVLVWTGLALTLRRFRAWRQRRKQSAPVEEAVSVSR
ncbi:MAG: PepSY domain-containing protein [Bryobacteraceae bacterium]|nr:PepSY domain-containing protein [Bryobacteraceae bacterium]MDW8377540.1 PepSY-associated TM helix domain-containing protein [Bryobacterales bacterium]